MSVAHIASAFIPCTHQNVSILLAVLMTVSACQLTLPQIKKKYIYIIISGWDDIPESVNIIKAECACCLCYRLLLFYIKGQTVYE